MTNAVRSVKLTAKQEAFAKAYIETGNASEAYRRSYNVSPKTKSATVNRKAIEVLQNGNVSARIASLQAKVAERHEITVDDLIAELDAARLKAMSEPKGASAAVSAIVAKGKLLGFMIERGEVGKPGDFARMSDAELERIASGGAGAAETSRSPAQPDRVH